MTNKCNYIKRSSKYIIGTAILATSLSSAAFGLDKDGGYYQIGVSADLKEFAELINSGEETDAKGILVDNIILNKGCVTEDGELKEGDFEEWIPIGTDKKPFEGELISGDEEIKTITGLYINNKEDNQGLIGRIGPKGKVSNIRVNGSYIRGKYNIGAIVGCNEGEINNCITTNSIIIGECQIGGNVGFNYRGIISGKCNNSGEIGGEYYVGGNVGSNGIVGIVIGELKNSRKVKGINCIGGNIGGNDGKITGNCSNKGSVTGQGDKIGGNVGKNMGIYVGDNNSGIISGKCNNSGVVIGKQNVGGNIGWNDATIDEENLTNTGTVNGESADTAKKIGYQR